MPLALALVRACTGGPGSLLKLWSACSISPPKALASMVSCNWFSSYQLFYIAWTATFTTSVNWLNQPSSFIQAVICTPEFTASIVPEASCTCLFPGLLSPAKTSAVLTVLACLNGESAQQSQSCRGTHQKVL